MSETRYFSEIEQLLAQYFDGLYRADSRTLAQVFLPDARYINSMPGSYCNLTLEAYLKVIDDRVVPVDNGERRDMRIISMEIAAPGLAIVKAEMTMMGRRYTDCLTLILADDRWAIIAKVFHYKDSGE